MSRFSHFQILLASFLGFTGVLTGALGAHALEETLESRGMVTVWQTAVLYHLVHALALLALGIWSGYAGDSRSRTAAGWCWITGALLFSGSLYVLALGGPRVLGPVTPLGGLFFMAGWISIFLAAWPVRSRGN
jgi:uncharacterized membrane protein YgdD (TMEM256/DUF423 family)